MYRLYQKNELNFSLVWIAAYIILFSTADNFSASLGFEKILTAPASIFFMLLILGFIKKHSLSKQYGLCSFKGSIKDYLYFIPLVLIASVNLWNGVTTNVSFWETILYVSSMLCVGFIEEILFRGFLFKAMCTDHLGSAIFVSSIAFGVGHIVNLLNGRDLSPRFCKSATQLPLAFCLQLYFIKEKVLALHYFTWCL